MKNIIVAGHKLNISKSGNWYIVSIDGQEHSRTMQYTTAREAVRNAAGSIAAHQADNIFYDQ